MQYSISQNSKNLKIARFQYVRGSDVFKLQLKFLQRFFVSFDLKTLQFYLNIRLLTLYSQALGTGIFLYITFAEILFPELKNKRDMRYKIPCICFGILIIGLASLLHTHSHGVEHHDEDHLDDLGTHLNHD